MLFRMASQGVAPDREAYTVLLKTYVCVCGGEGIWTEEEGRNWIAMPCLDSHSHLPRGCSCVIVPLPPVLCWQVPEPA